MVTPIDFIIYYHSQKLRMINSVYFYSIYVYVITSVSYTGIIAESLLVLSQSDSFFISVFKSFSIFFKSFPWIKMLVSSAYILHESVHLDR